MNHVATLRRPNRIVVFAAVALAALASTARAQRELKDVPVPDPEIERQSFQVAEGFEVNLFAADPAIAKPIQMNFDSAGRLWIASSSVYPHIEPGQEAHDKILIVEDADGDGFAEKTSVFVDDLLIPTGVEPGDGGAYVANSTELLHLRDTDGDGRADQRRIVLSGFGTEDTHHILHTLRWGPDGMLYFNQSIYIHSHIETPHGVRRLGGGGIWQFRPETLELDVYMRGLVNPWGHHFDRFGQSFATDGAGGEGINYVVPGAYYFTAVGATKILHGLNPGSPKHCGLEVVSGRHLPDDWQGNVVTNDFRANRVCRFVLKENGSGYVSRQQVELIKSANVAFRPIDVKMGPDGAIYIADWYNPIIQHGEVDFRDPRRDHVHGRIWRVTYKGRPLVERPKLVGASIPALLDHLKAPEGWTRHHARLQLKARGADVVPQLAKWVEALDPADPELERLQLEALWTYQALDVPEPNLLGILLRAQDHRVRAAATRVIQHWQRRLSLPLALLEEQIKDDHPRVRLEAVRGLAKVSSPKAIEIALLALDKPTDAFLNYALWLTSRELSPIWLAALETGQVDFKGREEQLIFALEAVDAPQAVKPLVALVEAKQVPAKREDEVLATIARLGGPDDLAMILAQVTGADDLPNDRRVKLLEALARATAERKVVPSGELAGIEKLLSAPNPQLRSAAIRAAGAWQVAAARPQLIAFVSADVEDQVRQAALDALVAIGGDDSRQAIAGLVAADKPLAQRRMAILALAALDLPAAANEAAALLSTLKAADDPGQLVVALSSRDKGADALAAALAGKQLPADVAKLCVRAARSTGREQPALIEALNSAGGLSGQATMLTPEQLAQLVELVKNEGDPVRGEAIFRRSEQACLKCHAFGGAGGQVGPDLSSIGASAQIDYLVESILTPNKAVKENYHSLVVSTDDGRILSGIVVRQNDTEVVLRNAEDQEISVATSSIEEKSTGGSIMPAGLADALTQQELVDLVNYLSQLGKGPYAVGQSRAVRRWRALETSEAALDRLRQLGFESAADPNPIYVWRPVYSLASGDLPLAELPVFGAARGMPPTAFLQFQLDVSAPGKIKLVVNEPAGLQIWVDGAPVEVAGPETVIDLAAGQRTFTVAAAARNRAAVRIALADVEGSAAQAQIVGGK